MFRKFQPHAPFLTLMLITLLAITASLSLANRMQVYAVEQSPVEIMTSAGVPAGEEVSLPRPVAALSNFLPPILAATKTDLLQMDNDGDGEADPGDLLRYTIVITNSGNEDATGVIFTDTIDLNTTLSGTAHVSPIAFDDSYDSLGNVGIMVPAGSGLLANDMDPDNNTGTLTVASADTSSANGGTVSVAADGSFTYTPAPGFAGADTFGYIVSDGDPVTPDGPGTVTITVTDVIWFVDNAAVGGGDGRLATPYNSLAAFNSGAADDPGDIIFLYTGTGNYTGGITLLDNQYLIGQGATASIAAITGITVPPHSNTLPSTGGTAPAITNGGGNGVNLAAGNTLRGFNVGAASGIGISGSSVGALTVSEVSVNNSSGRGVSIAGSGTMNAVFTSISATGSTNGISLSNTAGTFTVNGGTLAGHTAEGIFLSNTSGAVNFNNMTVNQSATANTQGVDATTVTNLSFSNTTITAGSGNAYALLGSTITNMSATGTIFDGGGGNVPNIDGVRITNLLGTNSFSDSTFRNGKDINLLIENNTNGGGLDTLTISGVAFADSAGGDHLQVQTDGTADLKVVVNASAGGNSTFSGTGQDGIQLEAQGGSTFQAIITGATFNNTLGSTVNMGAVGSGHLIARVHNLTGLTSSGTNVINMINFDTSTIEATIESNTITSGTAGHGIRVIQEGNGTITADLVGNNISGITQGSGILVQGRAGTGGNGRINATINNNTVATTGALSLDGIEVTAGSSAGGDTNTICLNMLDNTSSSGAFDGYFLRQRSGSTFQLQDFTGNGTSSGDITNWVNNVKNNTGSVFTSIATTFTAAPAACPTPTVPTALSVPATGQPVTQVAAVDTLQPDTLAHTAPEETGAAAATADSSFTAPVATTLFSGETVNIAVGTLPSGKSVTVIFEAMVDGDMAANDTAVCNQATVQSNELPDVLSDDPDTGAVNDPTCTAVPQADLSLGKSDGPDPTIEGSGLVYTLTVSNNGPLAAPNVVVTDSLPAGVTFVSTSGCAEDPNGLPTCTVGSIPAAGSAQVIIQTTVDIGTSGIITNTATVTTTRHDPISGNNTASEGTAVLELDYGDAPDPTYPTLAASNGARHFITGLFLGASVDGESDGQPNGTATGDDGDGNDDEDGVTFTSALVTGNMAEVDVVASAACTLSGWVDFNGDGDWAEANEDIFPGGTALAAGNNSLSFPVPAGAVVGTTLARFRCTTDGAVTFTGTASDGEVEDYQVEILDNQFSIGDVTMLEGNGGISLFMFTVTRTTNSTAASVAYATSDGTAVSGLDYTAVPTTTINFTAGGTLTQTAVVTVTAETLFELNETFTVTLSSPVNGGLGDGEGIGTILNDDAPPALNVADVTGLETAATFPFTVTLSAVSGLDASLTYSTTNGTAVAGSDYTGTSGSLTIPAGSATGVISVTLLDDGLPESTETFTLTLSSPVSATIGDGTAVGTIIDDENPPNIISVSDVTAGETAGVVTFTVSLDGASGLDVMVDYATNDGTATAGADYTAVAGTLTIANGTLSNTVAVPILDDSLDEVTETFTLDLSGAVNAVILDAQGVGTILDDDESPLAADDAYTVTEDALLSVPLPGLLANDSDGDGDDLTAVLNTLPANGTISLNADGSFTYTPTLNFNGTDSFIYHAHDGFNDSNMATVMLTVTAVNDPPLAVDDTATTVADTAVTVAVLANDVDVDGGDLFTVTAVTQPANGSVTINPDNTVTYTPTVDFNGNDGFTYVVTDGALTDTAVVTITVLPGPTPSTLYLPVVYNNHVRAPDLVVHAITVMAGGEIEVVIANEGNAAVRSEFWVDLYINPNPLPTAVNQIWPQLAAEGLVWGVAEILPPGSTLVLSSADVVAQYSDYSGSVASGDVIAVQVDSANTETAVGGVVEDHELLGELYNNIFVVTVE